MNKTVREIIEEFQQELIPTLGKYITNKTLLDVGCGNALNSFLFHQNLRTKITLTDVEDIRNEEAYSFPFYKSSIENLSFDINSFDVVFLQYVMHHIPLQINFEQVLQNLGNIGKQVIIVEEIIGENTDVKKAREFDAEMNQKIHPTSSHMAIYKYYTDRELKHLFAINNLQIIEEKMLSKGSFEDGFLQRKFYALAHQQPALNSMQERA